MDSKCAHADVLTAQLVLNKHRGNAALRLGTLPSQAAPSLEDLQEIREKKSEVAKFTHASLGQPVNTYKVDPDAYETIRTTEIKPAPIGKRPFKMIADLRVSLLCSVSGLVSRREGKGPASRRISVVRLLAPVHSK